MGQSIWRQVQKYGLAQKYGDDELFSEKIRMLVALAFVPPEETIDNLFAHNLIMNEDFRLV